MDAGKKLSNGLFFCLLIFISACKTAPQPGAGVSSTYTPKEVPITGTLQKQGETTYQYGTHVLNDKEGKTLYALKSETIHLDDYIGKNVKVQGKLVDDYPIDGGPPYLDVTKIEE